MSKKLFGVAVIVVAMGLVACTKGPSSDTIKQATITAVLKSPDPLGFVKDKAALKKKMQEMIVEKNVKCVAQDKKQYECTYEESMNKGLTFSKQDNMFTKNADGTYSMVVVRF